ncbi:unnamed protein product, partial [Allacma fusca]
ADSQSCILILIKFFQDCRYKKQNKTQERGLVHCCFASFKGNNIYM